MEYFAIYYSALYYVNFAFCVTYAKIRQDKKSRVKLGRVLNQYREEIQTSTLEFKSEFSELQFEPGTPSWTSRSTPRPTSSTSTATKLLRPSSSASKVSYN